MEVLPTTSRLRRRLLLGILATAGLTLDAKLAPTRRLRWFPEAEAAWLAIAQGALAVFSAFSKGGDNGVGAYLQNIRSLSEENIRLTQDVLLRVGQIQAAIEQLPARIHDVFVEVQGYALKQGTQEVLDRLLLVEQHAERGRLDSTDRASCQSIIDRCTSMAGARAAPYGLGGIAVACAPVIGAVEARAWWHLGRTRDFSRRAGIAYVPWFDQILTDQDGSIMRALGDAATAVTAAGEAGLAALPAELRQAMSEVWRPALVIDPQLHTSEAQLACVSYGRHTSDRTGACLVHDCIEAGVAIPPSQVLQRILRQHELTADEVRAMERANPRADREPHENCVCVRREVTPQYSPENGGALRARLINAQTDAGAPPKLLLEREWTLLPNASTCPQSVTGEEGDRQRQFVAARDSARARQINQQLADWEAGALATFNDQRAIAYAIYQLMDSARGAREQFRHVAR